MRVVGVITAREVSLTKDGAHPIAHALITKSRSATEPDMDVIIAKAIAGFTPETNAHFLTLSDTDMTAFLAKSKEEQAADVEKAKKPPPFVKKDDDAADMKKSIADIVRSVVGEVTAPLMGEIAELKRSNEALAAKDLERSRDVDLERRAASEFSGYPGGATKAVSMLKSIAGLNEAERADVEKSMKAQIELARRGGMSFALTEDELARAAPASTELARKAKELSKSKGMSESEAMAELGQDPSNSDLVLAAEAEAMGAN